MREASECSAAVGTGPTRPALFDVILSRNDLVADCAASNSLYEATGVVCAALVTAEPETDPAISLIALPYTKDATEDLDTHLASGQSSGTLTMSAKLKKKRVVKLLKTLTTRSCSAQRLSQPWSGPSLSASRCAVRRHGALPRSHWTHLFVPSLAASCV